MEDHDLIDSVEELRSELLPQRLHHFVFHVLIGRRVIATAVVQDQVAAHVGRHNHDRVLKVYCAPVPVGEPAIVEDLEQHVKHVGVRLLDLVKEDHRIGPSPHRLGELATLVVPHIARGSANQTRHGVLLHILGHVQAHQVALVVEQKLGQRPGQLGLAHPGGAQEDK